MLLADHRKYDLGRRSTDLLSRRLARYCHGYLPGNGHKRTRYRKPYERAGGSSNLAAVGHVFGAFHDARQHPGSAQCGCYFGIVYGVPHAAH